MTLCELQIPSLSDYPAMLIVIGLLCVLLLEGTNCVKVFSLCPTGAPALSENRHTYYCSNSADTTQGCPGYNEGLSYCSKYGLCCCRDALATCPGCTVPMNCSSDVCKASSSCPNHPGALCVIDNCGSCKPRFYVGKEEVTASCLEPPECNGKMYGGHCVDDDCELIEANGQLTTNCRRRGGECLVDLNNDVRCFTEVPRRKKPPKKDDDEEEDEEDKEDDEEDKEDDDCHPLPYCPDRPTVTPRPIAPGDVDDEDDETMSTGTGRTGTTGTTGTIGTTVTGTTDTTDTGTTGTTDTTDTGTTGTTDTTDTGTTGTTDTTDTSTTGTTDTTDTGTTGTTGTGTTGTGTTSTGTTGTGTTSTGTTGTGTTGTGTTSTGTTGTGTTGTGTGRNSDDDDDEIEDDNASKASKKSKKPSKKKNKDKRKLRSARKDNDYNRSISEDNPHYYRRFQRYYYNN